MKRRHWFLGLFVPLSAQVAAQPIGGILSSSSNCLYDQDGRLLTAKCQNTHRDSKGVVTNSPVPTRIQVKPQPANNECPVCGTMADPYVREKRRDTYYPLEIDEEATAAHRLKNPDDISIVVKAPLLITIGDPSRITRCAHCSCAFYQDASA